MEISDGKDEFDNGLPQNSAAEDPLQEQDENSFNYRLLQNLSLPSMLGLLTGALFIGILALVTGHPPLFWLALTDFSAALLCGVSFFLSRRLITETATGSAAKLEQKKDSRLEQATRELRWGSQFLVGSWLLAIVISYFMLGTAVVVPVVFIIPVAISVALLVTDAVILVSVFSVLFCAAMYLSFDLLHIIKQPLLVLEPYIQAMINIAMVAISFAILVPLIFIPARALITLTRQQNERLRQNLGQLQLVQQVLRQEQRVVEENERRLAYLAQASTTLSESLDYETILNTVARLAVPRIADWCSIYMLQEKTAGEDGFQDELKAVAIVHDDPEKLELAQSLRNRYPIRLSDRQGVAEVVRTGKSQLVSHIDQKMFEIPEKMRLENPGESNYNPEYLNTLRQMDLSSSMTVPITARGTILGAILFLASRPDRHFDESDLLMAEELAHRAGLAIDNALLYRAENSARRETETARERIEFLARVSEVLAANLDYQQSFEQLARLCVPLIADYCLIDVVEELTASEIERQKVEQNGAASLPTYRLKRQAVAHFDPAKEAVMRQIQDIFPPDANSDWGIGGVVRSGQTSFFSNIDDGVLLKAARDETHLQILKSLASHSGMSVPLVARGRTLGVMTLALSKTARAYNEDDLVLANEMARRAAFALDNTRLYGEAQRAIKDREVFLSVAAHELKTPITGLKGFSQLLSRQLAGLRKGDKTHREKESEVSLSGTEVAKMERAVDTISNQANNLALLVNQLLDISRIDTGNLGLTLAKTDLVELVKNVLVRAQHITARHQLKLSVDPTGPIEAMVDPIRYEQVVTNLVDNAIKYSPDGGEVLVELSKTSDTAGRSVIKLAVKDRGLGIKPEYRSRIFDRFYQAHERSYLSGMGLGLYISREIIELHHGTITAEFPPEGGSCFGVTIPA